VRERVLLVLACARTDGTTAEFLFTYPAACGAAACEKCTSSPKKNASRTKTAQRDICTKAEGSCSQWRQVCCVHSCCMCTLKHVLNA
jgi:hypothetical protein